MNNLIELRVLRPAWWNSSYVRRYQVRIQKANDSVMRHMSHLRHHLKPVEPK